MCSVVWCLMDTWKCFEFIKCYKVLFLCALSIFQILPNHICCKRAHIRNSCRIYYKHLWKLFWVTSSTDSINIFLFKFHCIFIKINRKSYKMKIIMGKVYYFGECWHKWAGYQLYCRYIQNETRIHATKFQKKVVFKTIPFDYSHRNWAFTPSKWRTIVWSLFFWRCDRFPLNSSKTDGDRFEIAVRSNRYLLVEV